MANNPQINLSLLIEGCRKGNRASQIRLYKHFYGYAMGVCLRFCKSRDEALEIVNDGFLKAFTKIDQYDPDQPFKPWLRRILINASIDYYRKYHKLSEPLDYTSSLDSTSDYVENDALNHLAYEALLDVIQNLSPMYRLVFNLYVMEGLSHQEIAEKLGISVGTSKSNLSKARQKIQSMLGASHGIYLKSEKNGG